jgi:ribokinase
VTTRDGTSGAGITWAFDVCVVGSANLDLVATTARLPAPGETVLGDSYAEHPGGKGLNQAVGAARTGAATAFVSAVGDDDAGRRLLGVMADDGIDSTHVPVLAGTPTGRALIGVGATGENSIIVVPGANAGVLGAGAPTARVVLAQLEVPVQSVIDAFAEARARGSLTVLNPAPARPLPAELLERCDLVVPNEHEVELLGGVAALRAGGVATVVVTLGERGCEVHDEAGVRHIAPFTVDALDTTAAGDTFCGALCAELAAGSDVDRALTVASAAAAISTTRLGAVPSVPRRVEVDELLSRSGR